MRTVLSKTRRVPGYRSPGMKYPVVLQYEESLYSFLILIFWLFMAPGGGGRRLLLAFFLLGLFNNTGYVVMNAGAKEITPCLVGLVYVANVLPSMSVKLTLPFWQHRVSLPVSAVSMCGIFMEPGLGGLRTLRAETG